MTEIIDAWMQIITPEMAARPWMASLLRWTGQSRPMLLPGREQTIAAMDAAGVTTGLLSAWTGPDGVLVSNEDVAAHVDAAPDRFRGVMSVNLAEPMAAVRAIRKGARHGFVGVRALPWLWDMPPNDRRFYPVYVACVEEGLAFCTQIGHTGPLRPSEPGRLIPYLEDVLLDFPELTVVGGHVGFPWIDEVISVARKFPNFFVDTSAYALHRLPSDFVEFLKVDGRSRILFGSNWPMLSPERCLAGLTDIGLEEETRNLFLAGNARRAYGLA